MTGLVLLLLGVVPTTDVVEERCDLLETNIVYDGRGEIALSQIIFWEWSQEEARYRVLDWRLIKSGDQYPQRDWTRGGYSVLWKDGNVTRLVRAPAFKHTDTQYDVEALERDLLPLEERKGLRKASR